MIIFFSSLLDRSGLYRVSLTLLVVVGIAFVHDICILYDVTYLNVFLYFYILHRSIHAFA